MFGQEVQVVLGVLAGCEAPEDKIPGWDPCRSLTVTVSVATLNRVRRRVLGRCHGEGS